MLLFTLIASVGAIGQQDQTFSSNSQEVQNSALQTEDITISLYPAPRNLGVFMDISNVGGVTITDLTWTFRTKPAITGTGIFLRETLQQGDIDQIESGETITIEFRPFFSPNKSPLGLGNLYMNASVEYEDNYIRTQQRALLLFFYITMYRDTYMDISPATAYEKFTNNEFDLIIDVVGLDIYSLGHLPGAVNYVWADGTLENTIPQLDKNLTYLVYCHTDPPSTASAQLMVDAGFENIYRLEGNYRAWVDAGYPTET
jgi:rhodanese-related sulfurtransferase